MMRTMTRLSLAVAALAAAAAPAYAVDGKNYGGMLCKVDGTSPASADNAYFDFYGRVCNASTTQPLNIICPLTKDSINDGKFDIYFDYVMWNLNGINGNQNTYPEQALECQGFSRTKWGEGYFWSGWKNAGDYGDNYGDTPHFMVGTVNKTLADGFIGARCQLPRKYSGKMSCLSHLCVDEAT